MTCADDCFVLAPRRVEQKELRLAGEEKLHVQLKADHESAAYAGTSRMSVG